MEFVDNTGHIFSLPSYNEKPIGYEYEEYSYVFWIDSNNTSKLSVNNFYSKPIYALYELITLIFNISFVWKYLFIMTGIFTLLMILFGNINVKVETK